VANETPAAEMPASDGGGGGGRGYRRLRTRRGSGRKEAGGGAEVAVVPLLGVPGTPSPPSPRPVLVAVGMRGIGFSGGWQCGQGRAPLVFFGDSRARQGRPATAACRAHGCIGEGGPGRPATRTHNCGETLLTWMTRTLE